MPCDPDRNAVVVELVGTPGAGKTTLTGALVHALRAQGIAADTIVSAARSRALRTPIGALVGRLPESRVRRTLLWYVFYGASLAQAVGVARERRALTHHVVQARRGPSRYARDTHAAFWFAQLAGRMQFLAATARPGEVLVVDDGFLHRAVHLHASPTAAPDLDQVAEYVDLVPRADLAVHTVVGSETCLRRVRSRGTWDHARDLDDDELLDYLERADSVARAAVQRAGEQGWNVATVYNEHRAPEEVARGLELEVARLVTSRSTPEAPAPSRPQVPRVPRPSRVRAQLAARFGRPVLPADQIHTVLDSYDVSITPGTHHDLRLGRRSLNVTVPTDHGDKVLKRYRPQWSQETVACGHSILGRLADRAFPAVRLVTTRDGGTFTVVDDQVFALFDFVPGTSYSLHYLRRADRLALTATAGRTLARFHRELDGFTPQGEHHLGFVAGEERRQRDTEWHARKLAELTARSGTLGGDAAEPAAILLATADELLARIAALESDLAAARLPRLVVHGDYGLHNLIYRSTTDAVVVDFESARLDWRVNDLISVLGKHRYQRDGTYDLESMETFLRAYAPMFPLLDVEQEMLPEAWRLYKCRAAVQYWNSYFETGGPTRKLWSAVDAIEQAELVHGDPGMIRQLAFVARAAARPTQRAS